MEEVTYRLGSKGDGAEDVLAVEVDAEIGLLLVGEGLQDPPAGGAALKGGIGQSLAQDGLDDLLPEEELAAAGILDDGRDGAGGGGAGLGVGALQVADDGENLGLAEGGELGVRRRLDGLGDGVLAGGVGPVSPRLAHCDISSRSSYCFFFFSLLFLNLLFSPSSLFF